MKIRLYVFSSLIIFFVFVCVPLVYALSPEEEAQERIKGYENKIVELQNTANSITKQITLLNLQISSTQLKMDEAKRKIGVLDVEIEQLNGEIDKLEELKTKRLELVLHRIPETYKRSVSSSFGQVLFSKNFSDFLKKAQYLMHVQEQNTLKFKQYQLAQNNYNDSKDTREKKKAQQEAYKKEFEQNSVKLAQQKREKQVLFDQTKNDEGTYQKLLSQAKAQLAGFASFASSQGGGILSGQTQCDGWGCYYNQRDGQWGNTLINGSNDCGGACSVARVGCLITSVAMAASHLGKNNISPGDIASSDPGNFSVGTALLKKGKITVKGVNITRTSVGGSLSPDVVKDGPVIVGVYHGPFGTHFVVVKSYSDGKYIMNDPYTEGGHDKIFADYYSINSVFSVERVSI